MHVSGRNVTPCEEGEKVVKMLVSEEEMEENEAVICWRSLFDN